MSPRSVHDQNWRFFCDVVLLVTVIVGIPLLILYMINESEPLPKIEFQKQLP